VNVSVVLAWGPSWYYQKQFFTGMDNPLSTRKNILRQDVEVSGFPSSHAGHIVLLRLKEDDYMGKQTIEEWPSWTLPVLEWAHAQGGITGYAHSGWGLEPITPTRELPNYVVPKMDNIGANEYIVTVTQHAVDFYSAGNTPLLWELNMWYHTLNSGFTTRLSGETDFPCVNDTEMGVKDSRLLLRRPGTIKVSAKAVANLPAVQSEEGKRIAQSALTKQPYWHVERARLGSTRTVAVELIVNGVPVDTTIMTGDGKWSDIKFEYLINRSSWVALRILGSAHTNPVFVIVDNKPIAEKRSVEWCIQAVDQCWKTKQANIRSAERPAAKEAYDRARRTYEGILKTAN